MSKERISESRAEKFTPVFFVKNLTGWHEAIEHALCYGWVDSIAHTRDEGSCYLKFTPRNPKSRWGKRNIERAKNLIAEGYMRPEGMRLIELAKSNGYWEE